MLLIGENLNIMSDTLGPAMRSGDAKPVAEMARLETEAGMDIIDLNIGPARRDGEALIRRVIQTVESATDTRLALDTTNMDAMEAGLAACRIRPLINSVSLQSSRIDRGLEMAARHKADVIALLWSNDGMPRDENERAMHAVDFVYRAGQDGIPAERIWIDPIVSPVSVEINQVRACTEFLKMLPDIAPGCKSVIGLSNISNGTPAELRGWLNRTYLVMLMPLGLSAAIVDAFDTELIAIARGQRQDIIQVIGDAVAGKSSGSSLDPALERYVKTVQVLTGKCLYSHAWLDA